MYANFWNAPKGKKVLVISHDAMGRDVVEEMEVLNKREARRIANGMGAECWNF